MNWPRSEDTWLDPDQSIDLNRAQRRLDNFKFWQYVDSQQGAYSHPNECHPHPFIPGARVWVNRLGIEPREQYCTDWRHIRDFDGLYCLAAKSDLDQCGKAGVLGLPFCGFHFDKAWRYLRSAVLVARGEQAEVEVKWDRERVMNRWGVEAAAVHDARLALARGAERVYFYRVEHAVKIGRSTNPSQRVKTLSGTKAPEDIDVRAGELLGTIPGGSRVEGALHQCYQPHRLVGEWFSYEPIADDIAATIAEHAAFVAEAEAGAA